MWEHHTSIMKNILLLALISITCSCQAQYPEYENIDAIAFNEQMKADSVTILDVRTPGEWAEGIIKGAVMLDFYDEAFADKIGKK